MKKTFFSSFGKFSVLALTLVLIGTFSSKTFAYTDAQYASIFNPNTSACTITAADVIHLTTGSFLGGGNLDQNKIYVLPAGIYTINNNITMDDCSVLVANVNTPGNVVFYFQGDAYITSNGEQNFAVRGHADHKIEILGATSNFGVLLQNSSGATISHANISGAYIGITFTNTKYTTISDSTLNYNGYGIVSQSSSTNNTIRNTHVVHNTLGGIWLQNGSHTSTIQNNTIQNNNGYGIRINSSNGFGVSTNTISGNPTGISIEGSSSLGSITANALIANNDIGMSLSSNVHTLNINTNTIRQNPIGIYLNGTKNNTLHANIISGNVSFGLHLSNSASGNVFTNNTIHYNTLNNIRIDGNSSYNSFTNDTTQYATRGIYINNGHFNSFSGTQVSNNTSGVELNASTNNTFNLIANTNGIFVRNNSNNNNIANKQIVGQNAITINNSQNNTITGGLFTTASTTTPTVTITLKNYSPAGYIITGGGLSGTYGGTISGDSQTLSIQLTSGNGNKDIIVEYTNGNKHYDSIIVSSTTTPSGGNPSGGGGGGGGGGSTLPVCIPAQLVCSGGKLTLSTGQLCQGGNLGNSCTTTTGNTTPIGNITGSPFSNEMNQAYLRSYANGITTMNTILKANMTGQLIRSHMAKMISVFAIMLGNKAPDTSKTCQFNDIAQQSTEMKFYINLACQLGLMGQYVDSFDPNGTITRAQFGTIMSRLIWGTTYNNGSKYYTNHLNALQKAGIINVTTPTMKELRGYVMIMMKRTYEGGFLNN